MALRTPSLSGYDAAYTGAVVHRIPRPGYLRIRGADRLDFVQRQTTNDVHTLAPGQSQLTVLTSPTARILDVWRLLPEGEAIGVVALPGRAATTTSYLQGRIFFMDKVTVENASDSIALFEVWGPDAAARLAAAGIVTLPNAGQISEVTLGDAPLRLIGQEGMSGQGWLLLAPVEQADAAAARLVEAGFSPVNENTYEILRVEAGLPGGNTELTQDATPLEVNLRGAISERKGCYTGQEVIARQVNYDKITRRLVGLRLDAPVSRGATVEAEERTVGTVSSAVTSPRFGPVALAIVKRPHFEPGTRLEVREGEERVPAVTVALPFA